MALPAYAKNSRAKVYALAFLPVLFSLCPNQSLAESQSGNCGNSPVNKIICNTPELSGMDHELGALLADKSAELDSGAATTLNDHQKDWFGNLYPCITFRLTDLDDVRVGSARQCIFEAYKKRHTFLTELPMDVEPQAPYLLSGFERTMLADGISNLGFDAHGMRGPMLKQSLNRVFAAIIKKDPIKTEEGNEFDSLNSFLAAADGLAGPYQIDEERYLLGASCERHNCTHEAAMIVDLKTGEVLLANSKPNQLNIMLKTCTSEELRRYAIQKFRDRTDDTSMRMYGKTIPPVIKETESDDCK